jgi:hypothetical protein
MGRNPASCEQGAGGLFEGLHLLFTPPTFGNGALDRKSPAPAMSSTATILTNRSISPAIDRTRIPIARRHGFRLLVEMSGQPRVVPLVVAVAVAPISLRLRGGTR